MYKTKIIRPQTLQEEFANSMLHGFASVLSIAGLVLLVLRAKGFLGGHGGGVRAIIACVLFAATMVVLFLMSTLYHAVSSVKIKPVLKKCDHAAIYFLIAGSYTAVCFFLLPPVPGFCLFVFEWILAITGICLQFTGCKALKKIELALYMLMGWAVLGAIPFFTENRFRFLP